MFFFSNCLSHVILHSRHRYRKGMNVDYRNYEKRGIAISVWIFPRVKLWSQKMSSLAILDFDRQQSNKQCKVWLNCLYPRMATAMPQRINSLEKKTLLQEVEVVLKCYSHLFSPIFFLNTCGWRHIGKVHMTDAWRGARKV